MLVFLWLGQGVWWQGAGGELIAWQVEPRAMEESEWQELLLFVFLESKLSEALEAVSLVVIVFRAAEIVA